MRRSGLTEIWASWSEVSIRVEGIRAVPDALLWGEVQGGSKPKRLKRAIDYAELHGYV